MPGHCTHELGSSGSLYKITQQAALTGKERWGEPGGEGKRREREENMEGRRKHWGAREELGAPEGQLWECKGDVLDTHDQIYCLRE